MSRVTAIWCPQVLTESGWRNDVRIDVDGCGNISSVAAQIPEPPSGQGVERLDGALIPGIPNLHSHAHQRAMAGLGERASGEGDSFWTWRRAMYRMLERIQPDQLYHIARMLYLEMLEAGYTHVAEFQYLHHDPTGKPYESRAEMTLQCARAAADLGIGFTALPVLYRYGGFGAAAPGGAQKRFLNDAGEFLDIVSGLQSALPPGQASGIAPHSLRAVNAELLQVVLGELPPGGPVHLHIAEQVREVEDCVEWSGMRPVEWLYRHFEPDRNWCLIHATHVTPEEARQIADSGAVAGLCPTTEANLGDGVFPAVEFFAAGGDFGIGSDSHISVSPIEELRWLEYGQRLIRRERNCLADPGTAAGHTGQALLARATTGGARACGFKGGAIAPGLRADLVHIDTSHPRFHRRRDGELLDSWIFSGNDAAIRTVFVGGSPVIQEGIHAARQEVSLRYRQTIDQLSL